MKSIIILIILSICLLAVIGIAAYSASFAMMIIVSIGLLAVILPEKALDGIEPMLDGIESRMRALAGQWREKVEQSFPPWNKQIFRIMAQIPTTLTPNRLKAIYLLWLFLNLMLLLFSPWPFGEKERYSSRDYRSFYPFISASHYNGHSSGIFFDHVEQYDITEFIFYSLAPLVFWQAARMWKRDSEVERVGLPNTSDTPKAQGKNGVAPIASLPVERALKIVEYAENEYATGRNIENAFEIFGAGGATSPLEALQALYIVVAHHFKHACVQMSGTPEAMKMFDDYAGLSAFVALSLNSESDSPSMAVTLDPQMIARIKDLETLNSFVSFLRSLSPKITAYWPRVYERLGLSYQIP